MAEKQEIIFVDGMKVKQRFEGLLGVSINVEYFKKFLEQHTKKGYMNIDICKSKDKDSWYARLNTWTPDKATAPAKPSEPDMDEIPF